MNLKLGILRVYDIFEIILRKIILARKHPLWCVSLLSPFSISGQWARGQKMHALLSARLVCGAKKYNNSTIHTAV